MNNIKTQSIAYAALFIALTTTLTWIQFPILPQGGLIHLGYIALFPIAIVFGKKYGLISYFQVLLLYSIVAFH